MAVSLAAGGHVLLAVPSGDGSGLPAAGTSSTPQMPGFPARRGYDLAPGTGTVGDAGRFAAALARASRAQVPR
jgi:hypothetical protein